MEFTIDEQAFAAGLAADVERVGEAVTEGLEEGIGTAAEMVAEEARARHPYVDRSGELTESTRATSAQVVREGVVVASVEATADHAVYVNRLRPFLEPAMARVAPHAEAEVERSILNAIRRRSP